MAIAPSEWTMSETLQFGHSMVPPHCRQNTAVARPRRFNRISDCWPASNRFEIAFFNAPLRMTSGPCSAYSWRMSTMETDASGRSCTRRSMTTRVYRALVALWLLSSDGVAEPSTTRAPAFRPRTTATSRPWYRGVSSCLNELSCSSSTMISPSWCRGANTADRVPTTTDTSPRRMRNHWSERSPSDRPLCCTATRSPNASRNAPATAGVRAISGTSTSTDLPLRNTRSASRRYTSVLPEPVTPCSRNTENSTGRRRRPKRLQRSRLLLCQDSIVRSRRH